MNIHEKFFSKIGFNYLIYEVLTVVFQIVLLNIIAYTNTGLLNEYNNLVIISAFCNYVLPLPIILFLMKKLDSGEIEKNKINIPTLLKYMCITLTLMWIGNIAGGIITYLIGTVIHSNIANPVENLITTSDLWLNLLLISIIGPIFEEFIFRKILVDRTIKYGVRVSIIMSATLFALIHGNLNQFFYAFLMGGFFAYVYIKTGKITYTIILHIFINLMGSVVSQFVEASANALIHGAFTSTDMAIVSISAIITVTALFIGLLSLLQYKKSKFNGAKTVIPLSSPLKTMFLNYGMILYVAFNVFVIIRQIFG